MAFCFQIRPRRNWNGAQRLDQEGLERTLAYFREQLAIIEKPAQTKSN